MGERLFFVGYHFPKILSFEIPILDYSPSSLSLRHLTTINRTLFQITIHPALCSGLKLFLHDSAVLSNTLILFTSFVDFLILFCQLI